MKSAPSPAVILRAARHNLEAPGALLLGRRVWSGTTVTGEGCAANDPRAVAWTLVGAVDSSGLVLGAGDRETPGPALAEANADRRAARSRRWKGRALVAVVVFGLVVLALGGVYLLVARL